MNSNRTMGAIIVALATAAGIASADQVFFQGFESGTADWFDYGGTITAVASGTGGVTSFTDTQHAVVDGGAFTRFDGYRNAWTGPMTARASIYLDTNWATGEGFEYTVAANRQNGDHLRDFVFSVSQDADTGTLIVGGSNNTTGNGTASTTIDGTIQNPNDNYYTVLASGWFTLEHVFRDFGDGSLAVDLNLYNESGTKVFTETRHSAADVFAGIVGGNRYGWFASNTVTGGINVDDVSLRVVPLPPAMLAGMGMLAGIAGVRKVRRGK